MSYSTENRGRSSGLKIRLMMAGAIVLLSLVSYLSQTSVNEITGEAQNVGGLTIEEEVQIGLQSVDVMAYRHMGPSQDLAKTAMVKQMGQRLVNGLQMMLERDGKRLPYQFYFHLLADNQTVNAFALPGGQVFITEALFDRFGIASPDEIERFGQQLASRYALEGQLAGVLGHEIGHVVERHGAERMARGKLFSSIAGAAGVAGGSQSSAQIAGMVTNLVTTKYSRSHELESDQWGVRLMVLSGYKPSHLLEVMDILESSSGGSGQPEFLSTHPLPASRKQHIQKIVDEEFSAEFQKTFKDLK